jgi:RNA polymerase sigma-70 factor (sigma-E family)
VRRRGSEFDDFVVGAAAGLQRMAIALTGDCTAAEDLVQDILVRMYVAWPRIEDPAAFARRALINAATNRWRLRGRRKEQPLSTASDPAVGDRTDEHGRRDELVRAISSLPSRQRAVVVLRFLQDMSEADTAAALGCSVGTVKSQTSRALTRLRELLSEIDDRQPLPAVTRTS